MQTTSDQYNRDQRATYEVHRFRSDGANGRKREPAVSEFAGLDRARIAALGHALDGPSQNDERFNGRVAVVEVFYRGERRVRQRQIDMLDERVAFRVLNELALPHADDLALRADSI